MKFRKVLKIQELKISSGYYVLTLEHPTEWDIKSTLNLSPEDLIRFNISPDDDVIGDEIETRLQSARYSPTREYPPDTVVVSDLRSTEKSAPVYGVSPPFKSHKRQYKIVLETPTPGGSLVVLPKTCYELTLLLTKREYETIKRLSAPAFRVSFSQKKKCFSDICLTSRATLRYHRVFPRDYCNRMIPLVQWIIDYFRCDMDVIGHYCGLVSELPNEKEASFRSWRQEYYAVDLLPKNWKPAFRKKVAETDKILHKRFNNKLPTKGVNEFYDNIEIPAYISKESYPVEEISIGLLAKYCMRRSHYLPEIVIEARSITGNRKACEAVCEQLQKQVADLFKTSRSSLSLDIEKY